MDDKPLSHPESLLERVAALEALEAIRNLKSRYARAADACLTTPSHEHAVALAALFTDDAVADYGPFGRFTGKEQLVHGFEHVLPSASMWSQHYMLNPVLSVSGDRAEGAWMFLVAAVLRAAPGQVTNLYGSYQDTYVRTPEGWKISALIVSFVEPPK